MFSFVAVRSAVAVDRCLLRVVRWMLFAGVLFVVVCCTLFGVVVNGCLLHVVVGCCLMLDVPWLLSVVCCLYCGGCCVLLLFVV